MITTNIMHLCGVDCATSYCCPNAILLFGTAEPGSGCMLNRTYKLTCLAWKSLYGSMCVCGVFFPLVEMTQTSLGICALHYGSRSGAQCFGQKEPLHSPVSPSVQRVVYLSSDKLCVLLAHITMDFGLQLFTRPRHSVDFWLENWSGPDAFGLAPSTGCSGVFWPIHITVISMQPANTETHWRRCNACIQTPTGHIHLCNTPPATIFPIPIGTCAIQSGSESKREWDYLVIRFSSCSFNL